MDRPTNILIEPGPWLDEIETRCRRLVSQGKPVIALIDELTSQVGRLRELASSTVADREAIETSLNIAAATVTLVFTVAAAAQWAVPENQDHHAVTRH
ncbi:hypothetical protein [Asaia lannensis]|uniref:hypothetical protein n=1 Tax=Asaia lannensis TaxID=415421 RepID=UPI003873A48C